MTSQKPTTPNTITLGLGFTHMNFVGAEVETDTNEISLPLNRQ